MGLKPQRTQTPRTGIEDALSRLFTGAIGGGGGAQNLVDIFQRLSIPQFGGPLTAELDPLQQQALGGAGGAASFGTDLISQIAAGLSGIAGGQQFAPPEVRGLLGQLPGADILGQIGAGGGPGGGFLRQFAGGGGGFLPPQIASLLGLGGGGLPGADILSQIAGGGGPGGGILSRLGGPQDVGQGLLQSLAGTNPNFGALQSILGTRESSPLAQFLNIQTPERTALGQLGGQQDFGGILSALDQARQASLGRTMRDVQERFSAQGLRGSTDLARALAEAGQESESSFLGQAAQLLPQLTGQRIGALQAGGQLGLGGAELGLGAAQGLTGAGVAQRGQDIGGASTLSQLLLGTRGQTGDILSQLGQLNLSQLSQQLSAGQGLQQFGLGAAGQLGQQGLGVADLLGQLFGAQQGRGLTAAQGLQQAGLGAAGQLGQQGLGAADIFSQLFGQQAGRQLGALQSLPQLAGLPLALQQQLFGLGEQARGVQDVDLQRQLAEFQRTQGALFGPILGFASGAPQITGPGKGSQVLGALATIASGAASKGGS